MSRVEGVGVEASTGLEGKIEPLPSLLAAIEAAEACCIKHERLSSPGTGAFHEKLLETRAQNVLHGRGLRFTCGGKRSKAKGCSYNENKLLCYSAQGAVDA